MFLQRFKITLRAFLSLSVTFLAGTQFNHRVLAQSSGLVAAYSFDEGSGTAVGDVSGAGHVGSITGATWTTAGKYGGALSFNGTSALVNVPDAPELRLTTRMTLEAWVNPSATLSGWRDVIYKADDNMLLEASTNQNRPAAAGTIGGAFAQALGPSAVLANTWTHLAATYDGTAVRLYVNGVQAASVARTGNLATSTNPLQIGGDSIYGQYFRGLIDDVRIYNIALTASQIQADMNTPLGAGSSPAPDLTLTKVHSGNFTQGQTGSNYTLTVRNIGTSATIGTTTVTDSLPSGLTATALGGTGWSCSVQTTTCTRNDALGAGASYPIITLTVSVAPTAPANVTNSATVSGGGDSTPTNNGATDLTPIAPVSDLAITKSHTGIFTLEQTGAIYTLVVRNSGAGATSGIVTVTDTLPAGLTPIGITGTGWSCTVATLTCTRGDALAAGSSYPSITLTVRVSVTSPGTITNVASVSGGGELNTANDTAVDPTTIGTAPDLTLAKIHVGNFIQGQVGASYSLTVSNVGTAPSNGTVTVTDTLPAGLTATALAGNGWTCTLQAVNCSRSDTLAADLSYPPITLTVDVAETAAASLTNVATVSGAGDVNTGNNSASDPTVITQLPDLTLSKTHLGNFSQGQAAAYTLTVRNKGAGPTTGAVTATDALPAGLTATALNGTGWNCSLSSLTCTRNDALGPSASYPVITLAVTVAPNAPATLTNTASVGGGGEANTSNDSAADVTTIIAPSSGLVAAYGFDEGNGTATSDASGGGHTGSTGSAVWTVGKYGGALLFDGTSSLVTVPDDAALRLTAGMTVEAWVKPSVALSGWRDIIYKGDDNFLLEASTNQGRPSAAATIGGGFAQAIGPTALVANTWTHVAMTYDGAAVRLFLNGVQVASAPRTGNIASSNSPLQIGGDSLYGQYFQGVIDEVRVYSIALGPAQIQGDMNSAVGSGAPDTQQPSAPSALSATVASGSQINLSWTGSTDNIGTSAYLVERCQAAACSNFVQVAMVIAPGTTFSDTGLTASTSYSYRVRASDAAGNLSQYSNTASVTTQTPDTEPPSAPGTLVATAVSGTQIDLTWGAATDNVGVAGYRVERCTGAGCTAFTKFGTAITGTSFSDTNLNISTSYTYIVRAQDAEGNLGPYSNVASATTLSTNPNLVAAYSFDEGAGNSVADFSGHANKGTIANATWTSGGKFGKALSFNGSNAMVTIPDSPSLRLTTGMTLEAWVNPSVANSGWKDVIYKGNDNYYLEGATPNGIPAIGITIGSSHTEAFGTAPLQPNVWTFVAATYDGSTLRFYINGTQVSSQPASGNIITSANPLQIGGDSIWGQFFQGIIDEVRVYSVALTPGQIQADMATAVSQSSPAVSLSTTSINFGNQPVGSPSSPVPATLTNGGTATLNVTSITLSGAQASDFAQTNNCVGSIAPFASCTISVTFTPINGGVRNALISVADNAPGNPHSVALTGTGTGFSITPQTTVLTPIKTQQFTVSGAGTSSVVWSVDNVAGGSASSGTITSTGLYTPPNSAGTHMVTVATTDGTKSASASVYVTAHAGVFTHHNDNQRTGQNLNESVLTLSNVNSASFGKLAGFTIDGIAHASPLYAASVNIPGVGLRNVVYVATEHDSVYAFDADASGGNPLWKVSFINPSAGITTVPNGDTGECCDIAPEIGITGTPVIDPSTGTLYVVAKTKEGSSTYVQRLHALDVATGAEKFGGPTVIQASVPGTGSGSVGGTLSFNQLRENQRTALLLYNGVVYMGFGSHGDNQPYHGWLLGYNATTLQRVLAFNSTPNGEGGGIWQSGGGLAIDSAGNFYFATGDGSYTINTGGVDYGDTFVRFNPMSGVVDYFTPHDQASLDSSNLDLDAGGMILLPDQPGAHPHLLVSAGKNGTIYVVDRDNMGHYNTTDRNVQTLDNIFPFGTPLPGNYSSPVYFNGAVYFGPVADVVQMFKLTNGLLSTAPTSTTPQTFAYPGGALSTSANGTSNGILWAIQKNGTGGGTLHAYDASNIAFELYNSDQAGTRDQLDAAAKFSVPLVVNGKVFVATEGRFTVFGLLP
jgi:uncharacterized repeat protein (TIGR01451 family)